MGWGCQCGGTFNRGHFFFLAASTAAFHESGPLGNDAHIIEQQRHNHEQQTRTVHPSITVNTLDFILGHEHEDWNDIGLEILQSWATLLEPPASASTSAPSSSNIAQAG